MVPPRRPGTGRKCEPLLLQVNGKGAVMRIADMQEFHDVQSILTMAPEATVQEAATAMAATNNDAAIVARNSKILGIFTERDLLSRVVAPGKNPAELRLQDVMTKDVITARLNEQVAEAIGRIDKAPFRHLPVLDESGNVAGLINERDFAAYTFHKALHRTAETVREDVSAWYQPFLILLAIAVYTFIIVAMVSNWR
jgi:CBS domain-containing protein